MIGVLRTWLLSIIGIVGMAVCGAAILILIVAKKRRKNAA